MQEQDIFGYGKGAAQVFNPARTMQNFLWLQQRRAVIEQRDNAMLQEMVQGYDPNKQKGLQAKDVEDYQKKYAEWKGLYLNNKDLMKNPSRYPDQYKRANDLMREMNMVVRYSEQDKKFADEVTNIMADPKKRDGFMDGAIEAVYTNRNIPVMRQIEQRGRLLDFSDIELKYEPVNDKTLTDFVRQRAAGQPEGMHYGEKTLQEADNSTFKKVVQPYVKFNPAVIAQAYKEYSLTDGNATKYYNQRLRNMKPEEIADIQRQVKETTGVDYQITDGETLGVADWMIRGSYYSDGKPVERVDEKKKAEFEMSEYKKKQNVEFGIWKQKESIQTANEIRVKQTPSANQKTEQEGLFDFSRDVVDALNRSDDKTYNQQTRNFFKTMPPSLGTVKILNPKKMSMADYKAMYKKYIAEGEVFEGSELLYDAEGKSYKRDDKWIEGSYGYGRSVMFVPVMGEVPVMKNGKPVMDKDGKPQVVEKKQYVPIDPKETNAAEKLMMILNKGFSFSSKSSPEQFGEGKK